MGLFDFFGGKNSTPAQPVLVDMHSHLIPGIDDGAETLEDSLELVRELVSLGYKKIITTPHIMGDFFKNTPEIINQKLEELRQYLQKNKIDITIEAAAEYYLDEFFMALLDDEKPMLTFGNKYLLFETSYINEPSYLTEALFKIKSRGYKPVLAHPERYTYLYSGFSRFQELYEREIFFQVNINSFAGYYSRAAQKFAEQLAEKNMIDFIGTDCHGIRHIEALKKGRETKAYSKLTNSSKLLNNSLLS